MRGAVGDADLALVVGCDKGGLGNNESFVRGRGHKAREPVQDEREPRVELLDELERAYQALDLHLLAVELGGSSPSPKLIVLCDEFRPAALADQGTPICRNVHMKSCFGAFNCNLCKYLHPDSGSAYARALGTCPGSGQGASRSRHCLRLGHRRRSLIFQVGTTVATDQPARPRTPASCRYPQDDDAALRPSRAVSFTLPGTGGMDHCSRVEVELGGVRTPLAGAQSHGARTGQPKTGRGPAPQPRIGAHAPARLRVFGRKRSEHSAGRGQQQRAPRARQHLHRKRRRERELSQHAQ